MQTLCPTITAARAQLLVRAPFYGSMALNFRWVETDGIGTMATDGRHIWASPTYCAKHGVNRVMGLIVHEILHKVNRHHLRLGRRDLELWNQATDLLINRLVERDGFELPPDLAYFDREGLYEGLSAEAIYDRLAAQQAPEDGNGSSSPTQGSGSPNDAQRAKGSGEQPGSGDPNEENIARETRPEQDAAEVAPARHPGEIRPLKDEAGKPLSDQAREQAEADLDVVARQAAALAKRAGKLPGQLTEMIEAAADRVDWRDKFRLAFDGTMKSDVSWSRPNRRFIPMGLYLPGWSRRGSGSVAVVLDVSGSITGEELSAYLGNLTALIEETAPQRVAVIQCDTEVRRVHYLDAGETLDRIEVVGRGGTAFQPAFDWIDENMPEATAIVYATDLDCWDKPDDPGKPVIWLTPSTHRTMSFGEVVRIRP